MRGFDLIKNPQLDQYRNYTQIYSINIREKYIARVKTSGWKIYELFRGKSSISKKRRSKRFYE